MGYIMAAATCDICGKKGAIIKNITRNYGKQGDLLIVENIPVVVCTHCGESYLTAETLHELERIRLHRRAIAKKRQVSVAVFS